jgi:nucleoside-diphosphate-sugar epimerase
MRVFVAGATGAIGSPLMSALIAAGHEAIGMTSTERGLSTLKELGADGVIANALDAQAVTAALQNIRPEAVIDELTSLPRHYTPDEMRVAAERDRRLRLEGGGNLLNAARAAGTRRYVVQSTGFFYGPGDGLAVESDALAADASPGIASSVRTYMQIEERLSQASGLDTVALRYGFFYGPGTWFSEHGDVGNQVRERKYPLTGSGRGVWSWIHVADAATATVAALDCDPGIYNIVDDDPCELATWLQAFADAIGAPEPPRITEAEALAKLGPDPVYYATRLRGASNAKAKQKLGFAPRRLEWLARQTADSAQPSLGRR